jgi:hypothetical protein
VLMHVNAQISMLAKTKMVDSDAPIMCTPSRLYVEGVCCGRLAPATASREHPPWPLHAYASLDIPRERERCDCETHPRRPKAQPPHAGMQRKAEDTVAI